jgi:hypothetical protein
VVALEDCKYVDLAVTNEIDDSIAADEDLTQVVAPVLSHDMTGIRDQRSSFSRG